LNSKLFGIVPPDLISRLVSENPAAWANDEIANSAAADRTCGKTFFLVFDSPSLQQPSLLVAAQI